MNTDISDIVVGASVTALLSFAILLRLNVKIVFPSRLII